MNFDWQITSHVGNIFENEENALITFLKKVDSVMNSNTFLLKGSTDNPISVSQVNSFFTAFRSTKFIDLFLEFDNLSKWHNYHEWQDKPASRIDFYLGFSPWLKQINKAKKATKLEPMSYLGFVERLHWMLMTSPTYYAELTIRPDEETTLRMIREISLMLFGEKAWAIGDDPPVQLAPPNWVEHPWTFYNVVPDFLYDTGYWEHNDNAPDGGYFDGGASDSCTFFFRDRVFYVLLTNGSP